MSKLFWLFVGGLAACFSVALDYIKGIFEAWAWGSDGAAPTKPDLTLAAHQQAMKDRPRIQDAHEACQVAFDIAVPALLKQGKKSVMSAPGPGATCLYRGPSGAKCAVGHLIDDKHYDSDMEGQTPMTGPVHLAVQKSLRTEPYLTNAHEFERFLVALVNVHDRKDPADWPAQFLALANEFSLTPSPALVARAHPFSETEDIWGWQ